MCGIFGSVFTARVPDTARSPAAIHNQLRRLFLLSEARGKEAAGLAALNGAQLSVYKDSVAAHQMLQSAGYRDFWRRFAAGFDASASFAAIGHTRLVTNGLQVVDANNQPVVRGTTVVVHNGIIVNDAEIWRRHPQLTRRADVDTEVFAALLDDALAQDDDLFGALDKAFAEIFGETTVAALFADRNVLALASNTGSAYACRAPSGDRFFFVSEEYIARQAREGREPLDGFAGAEIVHVKAGTALIVDLDTLDMTVSALPSASASTPPAEGFVATSATVAPRLATTRRIEEKHECYVQARKAMRRCTRCVLPETMPFIEFDEAGVCNYCRSTGPIQLKGRAAIESELAKLRSAPGAAADCLVAFSGGRDSSYGLHLLVKELGMKPLTYTYDWGMVTDLGRRNQARMCAKLGVEHIWVSADIRAKRDNIRRNVLAWLKRPDLGMIPLFMAGDKQFFYFANRTMTQTGLSGTVFCMNPLERTDFKSGFAGIRPDKLLNGSNDTRPFYNLHLLASLKLAGYYAGQYLQNPAYVNRSIPDTTFAYASYYLFKQPFLNVYDYLPWREETVNKTLLEEYDWETAPDTGSTWRIGDGTAPFYNYIYHEVAGFSEFDTFRSNQIREGQITREQAMALIEVENQPRWESLRHYCLLINVDFEECLRTINSIPKLYTT
jgi:asparagine synthetase B (glutamine-hydrolysing)